jgi:hypothetical protein
MNVIDRNGANGGRLITPATGAVTGLDCSHVTVLEDGTTFSVLTNLLYPSGSAGAGVGDALTSRTWKRGDVIRGVTTAITLTAGACDALTRAQ